MANPLWGAPRVHGELLMLGIEVAQSTVAKYMIPRSRRPPLQNWKTFLHNHAPGIASIDLFVVPTAFFKLLHAVVILSHERWAADMARRHRSSERRMARRLSPGTKRHGT
jgi:hypothetical protein